MAQYDLDALSTGSGLIRQGQGSTVIAARTLVYLNSVGQWALANAEDVAKMDVVGFCLDGFPGVGLNGRVLLLGLINYNGWSWTPGQPVYASAVVGELTQTAPQMASNVVQTVGYAISSTLVFFSPRLGRGLSSPTYTKRVHVGVGIFKIPAAGAPAVVIQDNTVMLSFNQNDSEDAYLSWEVPTDYAGGDLSIYIHWTNDGGVDDNGKNVRWEINYQSMGNTTVISGNHANSPKVINDTYTSAAGWIFHTSPTATIVAADFSTRHQIEFNLTALAAAATQLTGESHFIAMMLEYTAYSDLG